MLLGFVKKSVEYLKCIGKVLNDTEIGNAYVYMYLYYI